MWSIDMERSVNLIKILLKPYYLMVFPIFIAIQHYLFIVIFGSLMMCFPIEFCDAPETLGLTGFRVINWIHPSISSKSNLESTEKAGERVFYRVARIVDFSFRNSSVRVFGMGFCFILPTLYAFNARVPPHLSQNTLLLSSILCLRTIVCHILVVKPYQ